MPHMTMRGLVVALLLILLAGRAEAFHICAFNAQRLSLAKVTKESVIDILVQVNPLLQKSVSLKTLTKSSQPCLTRGMYKKEGTSGNVSVQI